MELTLDTPKGSALALPRCQHRTPAGRRCRFTVKDQSAPYCPSHSGLYLEDPAAADLVMKANNGKRKVPTLQVGDRYFACSPFNATQLAHELNVPLNP